MRDREHERFESMKDSREKRKRKSGSQAENAFRFKVRNFYTCFFKCWAS